MLVCTSIGANHCDSDRLDERLCGCRCDRRNRIVRGNAV